MFVVDAEHHDIKGRLTMRLFNERLATVHFAPDDWPAYLAALERAGVHFDGRNDAHIPLATRVWKFDRNKYAAPFVGWTDTRFDIDVSAWIFRCS
jgi:hypothetical protein